MSVVSAEKNFRKGLESFADESYLDAAMYFRRAMDIEHQRRVPHPDMRFLSYYGLCRAKAHGKIQEGLHACKRAALVRKQDPEMYLNLGRVYLMSRQKQLAYRAFQTGLDIDPGHETLSLESDRLEKRLPRSALSRRGPGLLSRMRSALSRSPEPPR